MILGFLLLPDQSHAINHRNIMNAIIQGQLDRIEAALNTLVSSIESYNPSVPAAIDLLAADTELQEGVKQRNPPL